MDEEHDLKIFNESFLKFESTHKLFALEINGVLPWHIIRFDIYSTILKEKYNLGQARLPGNKESLIKRVFKKAVDLPDIIKHNVLTYKNEKDILIFNHQRKVKNGKYYECLYSDVIAKNLSASNITVENPYMDGHLKPARNNNTEYTDMIFFLTAIKRPLKSKKRTQADLKIDKLINAIVSHFEININQEGMYTQIKKSIFIYRTMYKYYDQIIQNINPKVIIQVVSYSTNNMIVNSIAKKRSIPTVELQHGVMGKYHIAYNFLDQAKLEGFPDYLFTFGQFWKDNTRLPIAKDRIKVVGWPYYEQKVEYYSSAVKNTEKQTILFISQPGIGKRLSEQALKLYELMDKKKYRIIYKLHPKEYMEWQKEYPWLLNTSIEVVDTNEHDMHYYFAQSDIQIGVSSTALFEGLGYGLKTLICKLPTFEYMEELISDGTASLVENENEMYNKINQDKIINTNKEITYFWEKDSLNKILRNIDEIINNNKAF